MVNYKLIVFDLDGTLLTANYELLRPTIKAVEDIRDSGVKISIATGRNYKSAEPFLDKLKITEPAVLCNGSVLNYPQTGEKEVISSIPRHNAAALLKLASEFGVSAKIHLSDGTLYKLDNTPWPDEGEHFEVGIVKPDIKETLSENPIKIVLYGLFDQAQAFEAKLKKTLGSKSQINMFQSSPQYVEITNKNSSKGTAVIKLARKMNIKPAEVIGVGDYDNDYEMLRDLGLGIVVGEGTPKLNTVAQHRIPKPENQGIEELRDWLINLKN